MNRITRVFFIPILLLALCATGCARPFVEADAMRKSALEPIVADFIVRNPDQRERWDDFMSAWKKDIDVNRKGVLPWWLGGGQTVTGPAGGEQ